jgi:multidrug efflux pump subunit AcrB
VLTSLTTIAALLPLLLERNTQAQVLIPMAISITFGLALATVWILYLVPTLYQVYGRLSGRGQG